MNQMMIPDPNVIFPNEYHTSCFIKNVVNYGQEDILFQLLEKFLLKL